MFARSKYQSANFSQWLNLLLVAFIFYGTTVEAAHWHGRILSERGAASHVDNQQTKNLTTNKTGCSDCLICQLHQHFTTTLIALRLAESPTQETHRAKIAVPRDLLSQIVGPTAGRAPPSIS